MVPGVYAAAPVLAAWLSNNSEPYYRRATSIALGVIAANSVCFGDKYNNFPTHSLSFRVVFWVSGAFQPMKDQNLGKQQSWISFCECPLWFPCHFSVSYLPNSNPIWLSSILAVVISLVNVAYLTWRNKVKKRPEERAKLLEKYVVAGSDKQGEDDGKLRALIDLGDRHPDFVYTLWSCGWDDIFVNLFRHWAKAWSAQSFSIFSTAFLIL